MREERTTWQKKVGEGTRLNMADQNMQKTSKKKEREIKAAKQRSHRRMLTQLHVEAGQKLAVLLNICILTLTL